MAGHKFCNPGRNGQLALRCPRMSPKLYVDLRDRVIAELLLHFTHVVVSTEAPDKPDHGDVDMLLCGPLGDLKKLDSLKDMEQHLACALKVTRSAYDHGILFMARPIPAELLDYGCFSGDTDEDQSWRPEIHPEPHIQFDLVLCDAPSQLNWLSFLQAHGDLSNILQIGLKEAGFTFKPSGLHLRIPEIEMLQKNDCFFFLSNDINDILNFFGLDPERYVNRFSSRQELFSWIVSCNYFTRTEFGPEVSKDVESYFEYMSDRAMFNAFRLEFLPSNPTVGFRLSKPQEKVFSDALKHFKAHDRYLVRLTQFRSQIREIAFWNRLTAYLPIILGFQPSNRRVTHIREGLKRFVEFRAEASRAKRPVLREEAQMVKDLQPRWTEESEEGGFTEDELFQWIRLHWQRVLELERNRDKPRRRLKQQRMEGKRMHRRFQLGARFVLVVLEIGLGILLLRKFAGI